jgi:hypothetical protein
VFIFIFMFTNDLFHAHFNRQLWTPISCCQCLNAFVTCQTYM